SMRRPRPRARASWDHTKLAGPQRALRLTRGRVPGSGTEVLRGPAGLLAELPGRPQGPVRIAQQLAREEHAVRALPSDDLVGLRRFSDETHGPRCNTCVAPNPLGKGHLISGGDGNRGVRDGAARRAVDEVHAEGMQPPCEPPALVEVPPALLPIGARQADTEGLSIGPDVADGSHDFQAQPDPIVERAAVFIGA